MTDEIDTDKPVENKKVVNRSTYDEAVRRAEEIFKKHSFPSPTKPAGFAEEYTFPTDPAAVSIHEVGKLMMTLAAWKAYCAKILAEQDGSLQALESVYDIILGYEMWKVQKEHTTTSAGRLVKEQLIAIAINSNETLRDVYELKTAKSIFKARLAAQYGIYDSQFQALSREVSRRETESRVG